MAFLLSNDRTFATLYRETVSDKLERSPGDTVGGVRVRHGLGRGTYGSDSKTMIKDEVGAKGSEMDECKRVPMTGGGERQGVDEDVSLEVSAYDLYAHDSELAHALLHHPSTLLTLLEDAAVEAQRVIWERTVLTLDRLAEGGIEAKVEESSPVGHERRDRAQALLRQLNDLSSIGHRRVHVRLSHLPPRHSFSLPGASHLSAAKVGTVIQISGTVVRASPVRMIERTRSYRCAAKGCGHCFTVHADFGHADNALPKPALCSSTAMCCSGTTFVPLPDGSAHADYQEIKIQDRAGSAFSAGGGVGSIPRSVLIKLTRDLVDSCRPGDDIWVTGNLLAQWPRGSKVGAVCDASAVIRAHSIRVVNTADHSAWRQGSSSSSAGVVGGVEDGGRKYRAEFDEFWSREENQKRPIAARNFIIRAVCPKLYGMLAVKLALLIVLIGGTSDVGDGGETGGQRDRSISVGSTDAAQWNGSTDDSSDDDLPEQFVLGDGSARATRPMSSKSQYSHEENGGLGRGKRPAAVQIRRRAQSHILLVGDPGCGKSQFLRFAAALSPRSVLTTGTGCSSAGLTCAAVKDGTSAGAAGEFTLEAGALVLADRGVCCIDEFGCIESEDRTTIHEAMEQQTISVAKAGIVCKLNTRASVVAVMNPRGALYETKLTVEQNTNIGSPLLSRFDLVFVLLDSADLERDDRIASFLLNNAISPGAGFRVIPPSAGHDGGGTDDCGFGEAETHWRMEKLRAYIAHVKEHFQPSLSPEAALLLERHYAHCRSQPSSLHITVRFLESLIRLAQAHARLMYRDTVTLQDAAAIVLLMECTAATSGGLYANFVDPDSHLFRDPMRTDFPANNKADENFSHDEHRLLHRYGMLDGSPPPSLQPNEWAMIQKSPHSQGQQDRIDHWGREHTTPRGIPFSTQRFDSSGGGQEYSPLIRESVSSKFNANAPGLNPLPCPARSIDDGRKSNAAPIGKRRRRAD